MRSRIGIVGLLALVALLLGGAPALATTAAHGTGPTSVSATSGSQQAPASGTYAQGSASQDTTVQAADSVKKKKKKKKKKRSNLPGWVKFILIPIVVLIVLLFVGKRFLKRD